MKYDTVEIRPNINNEWTVRHYSDKTERAKTKTFPHPLGFFHYPRRRGANYGFNTLKNFLIKQHEEEIHRLQKSLEELKKITWTKS